MSVEEEGITSQDSLQSFSPTSKLFQAAQTSYLAYQTLFQLLHSNNWETIHPMSELPGWMGGTDIFIPFPQAASQ